MSEDIVRTDVQEGVAAEGAEVAEGAAPEETAAVAKREKKLTKAIEGTIVKITAIGGEHGEMSFDTAELPEDIQKSLIPFGASHKLGDAAAGRSGKEAEEAIKKVWEGLVKGDWTVRAPAAPKVSLTQVKDNLAKMSDEERAKAQELLAAMGISINV